MRQPTFSNVTKIVSNRAKVNPCSIAVKVLLSPSEWARESGYEFHTYRDQISAPAQGGTELHRLAFQFMQSKSNEAHTNIAANDLNILHWNWGPIPNLPSGEICFHWLSERNILLGSPHWLRFFPFVEKSIDPNQWILNIEESEHLSIREQIHFCGGFNQEGHFLMDFLPSLFKIKEERNNQDIPILVSQLTDRQREIIALFGLNFNFFEIEPSTPRSLKIINLSAADISLAISPVAKATFFRNEVQLIQKRTMHLNSGINGLKRTLFYFKRNGNETPSRVSNHAEIGNELEKIGFSSLQCDCLNIQELIATLADAKVVVAEPGTPASNFFNFCPKDCKLIWLMPQYASDAKDLNVNEPVFDVISRNIENVYVFPGEIVDGAYSWSTPHTYSAHRLTELVRKLITL